MISFFLILLFVLLRVAQVIIFLNFFNPLDIVRYYIY